MSIRSFDRNRFEMCKQPDCNRAGICNVKAAGLQMNQFGCGKDNIQNFSSDAPDLKNTVIDSTAVKLEYPIRKPSDCSKSRSPKQMNFSTWGGGFLHRKLQNRVVCKTIPLKKDYHAILHPFVATLPLACRCWLSSKISYIVRLRKFPTHALPSVAQGV